MFISSLYIKRVGVGWVLKMRLIVTKFSKKNIFATKARVIVFLWQGSGWWLGIQKKLMLTKLSTKSNLKLQFKFGKTQNC